MIKDPVLKKPGDFEEKDEEVKTEKAPAGKEARSRKESGKVSRKVREMLGEAGVLDGGRGGGGGRGG